MKLETFFNKIVKQLSFCENLQEVIEKYSETTLNKETSDFLDMLINYFNSKSFYKAKIYRIYFFIFIFFSFTKNNFSFIP